MILILSETTDITTDRVIEWLHYFGFHDILRINEGTPVYVKQFGVSTCSDYEIVLISNGRNFAIDEVEAFWYRRGRLTFSFEVDIDDQTCRNKIAQFHKNEWLIVRDLVIHRLEQKPHIGNFFKTQTNKLKNLSVARSCGLNIPQTFISNYALELSKQVGLMGDCICKPISEVLNLEHNGYVYETFTTKVKPSTLTDNNIFCAPQLIQERIDKWIEIRVFIVNDNVYSMAIFSQNHESTSIDYRDRDVDITIRKVRFLLPDTVKDKLLQFMSKSGLNTGSIDMILDKKGNYIFLEVNPVGVIDMVSTPCNYNIEKQLAKQLIDISIHERQ